MMRSLIVAAAQNGIIGKDNKMLWHIPEDFKYFKSVTLGKPVIMGRKTYESILDHLGKPLPKRVSIVITRQTDYKAQGDSIVVNSLEKAIAVAEKQDSDEVICIGGAQIYQQFLPFCERVYLTVIEQNFEGDAKFPILNNKEWKLSSSKQPSGETKTPHHYEIWERII